MLQQRVLEVIALHRGYDLVRSDAAATIDRAPTVGKLHFLVGAVRIDVAVVVVVVERHVGIITLDQASARGVVPGCRERQSGVFRERIYRLHKSLAEGGFADDEAAIMILDRAGHDLRR